MTAIVGYSGSGKSTIAKLIAGFRNADSGGIRIGGDDLSDMPLAQGMGLVTYVSQENFLFHKSIEENLRMAKTDASPEEIRLACRKANCHDFIMALPDGYDTVLGDSGSTLSGGERQRISIARAMLKPGEFVILDEATSSIDPENEQQLLDALQNLLRNKTVIVIAHRMQTIRNADQIVVLAKGGIESVGTHEQLIVDSPTYQKFIHERTTAANWTMLPSAVRQQPDTFGR